MSSSFLFFMYRRPILCTFHITVNFLIVPYRIQKLIYIKLSLYLFFMWRLDFMILMRANPLLRPLEGVGHEIKTFLGPDMATSEASAIWCPCNGCCPHQNHYVPRQINNRTLIVDIPLDSINRSCASKSDILVSFCAL
jgi:hypothetical protein